MYIHDEFSKLRTIILGSSKKYLNYNKSEKQNNIEKNVLKDIKEKLKQRNIKVIEPNYIKNLDINESLWVRDSSIVIDNKFILLPLQDIDDEKRKLEYKTVIFNKSYIIPNNEKIKIEGGDIFQLKDIIFIGINERTNLLGYKWLRSQFPNKNIIKINHNSMHLDCCFNILPNNVILYSKKYIKNLPQICLKNYKCINVDNIIEGDTNLSTNFIFLDKNTILIDNQYRFNNIKKLLKSYNYKLIIINLQQLWRYGGSIRCLTQPLLREG